MSKFFPFLALSFFSIDFSSGFFFFRSFFVIVGLLLSFRQIDKILDFFEETGKDEDVLPPEKPEELGEVDFLTENIIQKVTKVSVTFSDVAGNEEAKNELQEVVKFLKNPKSFEKLGAGIPKGVLLGGPPGTGKTLLAKAIAGEAGTAFFQISGSQFVELLVGVGASRVRQLFAKARASTPAIIYIDEIDSIAKTRSLNSTMGAASDEREQTLNQILTEMDGFKVDSGIVVLASTNRLDSLDPAIKRPGRFDRQILLSNPTLREREAILKVHAQKKKLDPSVSFSQIAQRTLGFSGAELANLLNEAAILATREKKVAITMKEINRCIDRLLVGGEKNRLSRAKAKFLTAFHETGHAFLGSLINQNQTIQKISILPRGSTAGSTWTTPTLSQYQSKKTLTTQILIAISGRAAEESVFGKTDYTVGAQQDLDQISRYIRIMISRYAMYRLKEFKQEAQERNLYLLGSDVKQELSNIIDNFTTNFIDLTYQEVLSFLEIVRPGAERLVDELITEEELTGSELKVLAKE
jgi:cell division protease FtsH